MKRNRQAELINLLTPRELLLNVYVSQVILVGIALFGGWLLFEDWFGFFKQFRWDGTWFVLGLMNGFLVVLLDVVLMNKLPTHYYNDGGINAKLFSHLSVWKTAEVALVVAITEEILFRGVIQSNFGLLVASLIFALIHFRYWSHWFLLLNVTVLSFWIGIIYHLSGNQLLPVIAMHFVIDFLLGIYTKKLSKPKERRD